MHGIGGFPVREGLEWSVAAGPAAYSRGRLGGREKRMADSFFKLVAAVVAKVAPGAKILALVRGRALVCASPAWHGLSPRSANGR